MKAIGKCEVCGGKIIQAGNGNIFCEDCADKNFGERLQEWADKKEKQPSDKQQSGNNANRLLAAINPFIASTAKDYDMSYKSVEVYYNQYGSTPMFYEKLEEHLKHRSF